MKECRLQRLDGPRDYHIKWRKTCQVREKDRYHTLSLICGIWQKKNDTNELKGAWWATVRGVAKGHTGLRD